MIFNKKNFFNLLLCLQTVCSYAMENRRQNGNMAQPVAKKQCNPKTKSNSSEENRINHFLSEVKRAYEEQKKNQKYANKIWVNEEKQTLNEIIWLKNKKKALEEEIKIAEEENIKHLFEDAKKTIVVPPVYRMSCKLNNLD